MSNTIPDPEPQHGISLEELADAFAQVMGQSPRVRKDKVENSAAEDNLSEEESGENAAAVEEPSDISALAKEPEFQEQNVSRQSLGTSDYRKTKETSAEAEDNCPISPKSILEAMLFVGNRENRPLSAVKAAELMRDVATEDIPAIVEELNARYESENCPYSIIGEGDGYRLTLRKAFHPLRNKLYGRIREARLSQAAIDVLALVAYKQPLSGEQVHKMRGKPSSHILAQLVRRGLLRLERPAEKPRIPCYATTERFMKLFNLDSLDDLPRSEEPG
jgi:segregation and condensation protein B